MSEYQNFPMSCLWLLFSREICVWRIHSTFYRMAFKYNRLVLWSACLSVNLPIRFLFCFAAWLWHVPSKKSSLANPISLGPFHPQWKVRLYLRFTPTRLRRIKQSRTTPEKTRRRLTTPGPTPAPPLPGKFRAAKRGSKKSNKGATRKQSPWKGHRWTPLSFIRLKRR